MRSVPAIFAVRMDNCSVQVNLERIARWSALVPVERALRIARFRHWEDQWRSLAGDMLLSFILREKYRLPSHRMIFTQSAYGKPKLSGNDVHFNVSHSGVWAVAAFHSEAIGIDIEQIAIVDMELARSIFLSNEYEALCSQPAYERDRMFYMIWTAKESYIKAIGKGLSIPLDSFSVAGTLGNVRNKPSEVVTEFGSTAYSTNWHLRQFELDPDYMLTVCSTSTNWPTRLLVLDATQLN
ncbi:4'-phosphopantetheinyl transferase family protein [Paenibacillus endoradicis]|uniref:4'-phosphopantetheinyl transferase family protein n=1 Tax=Paenibacillus endoradicis TaxID=2972487 RepID=UPI002158ACFE|nr:4'-phosphopantetheinyl transferase superfamily protein [Paenibacillus endoradicis]MCR8656497.1 4'-phosphopantetheinyl transferase superfamily protein [Paenibacillus endoradicis]